MPCVLLHDIYVRYILFREALCSRTISPSSSRMAAARRCGCPSSFVSRETAYASGGCPREFCWSRSSRTPPAGLGKWTSSIPSRSSLADAASPSPQSERFSSGLPAGHERLHRPDQRAAGGGSCAAAEGSQGEQPRSGVVGCSVPTLVWRGQEHAAGIQSQAPRDRK